MRYFGEYVPFANLASINLWGCVFLPPLVASQTSQMDDVSLMIPGLWIMALSYVGERSDHPPSSPHTPTPPPSPHTPTCWHRPGASLAVRRP